MRKIQTRLTRKLPRYLVIERRVLEVLEERDREFDALCFELRESPSSVRRAVSTLMNKGWIQLVHERYHATYHSISGALVGWTREQET